MMEKKRGINRIAVPVIMIIVGFGLMTGCGNKKPGNQQSGNMDENSTMSSSESNKRSESMMFTTTLSGDSEVPAVTTDASGSINVRLKGDSLWVKGEFSDLSSKYTASHIHMAAKGKNGGVIQPLNPQINSDSVSGSFNAAYALSASQISTLEAGNLYINVHSTEHPSGEIRGQLTASDSGM